MTGTDVIVIIVGAVLIAAVNWWFFVAGRQPTTPRPGNDATPG